MYKSCMAKCKYLKSVQERGCRDNMAQEPFLINPPKFLRRGRKKVSAKLKHWSFVSRRKNPVGETLVTIGANPMGCSPCLERRVGMRNPLSYVGVLRGGKYGQHGHYHFRYKKSGKGRKKAKKNPVNAWFGQIRRHRKSALRGWVGRRRHRRNPAVDFGKVTSGIMDVRGWAPLAVTGGLSAITGAMLPGMVGIANPWAKLGVQTVVAIGGGVLVDNFVDKRHGQAWMVVGVSMVGYQLLKQFVLMPYFPQLAVGLGEYNDYYLRDVSQEVGAFPQEVSAFPGEVSAYPGVGTVQEEVGAYPYDGSGY